LVSCGGPCWRSLPEKADPRESEPMIDVGSKVSVVGFGEGGVMLEVPTGSPYRGRERSFLSQEAR
jgi:hypothetical protein